MHDRIKVLLLTNDARPVFLLLQYAITQLHLCLECKFKIPIMPNFKVEL